MLYFRVFTDGCLYKSLLGLLSFQKNGNFSLFAIA